MSKLNCPNCGAPIDPITNKCSYCGTSYFDMSTIDFMNGESMYLKIRTGAIDDKPATITMKCIPRLGDITINTDTTDLVGCSGIPVKRIVTGHQVVTNISFDAVVDTNGEMMRIEIPE